MRKEVIVAIVLGSLIGIAVAFGVWRANVALQQQREQETVVSGIEQALGSPTEDQEADGLIVIEPEDGSVVNKATITVSGKTDPEAVITLLYNEAETILTSEKDGSFQTEIELTGGPNEIKVISFNAQGDRREKILTVVFSTEFPTE